MSDLTTLENQVLLKLLDGNDDDLAILRQQVGAAAVSSRQMTGVGFFTKFLIPPQTPRVTGRPSFKIGDVNGTAGNVSHGLGFLLYVTDGALTMLEGYTYNEPWPDEIHSLALTYSSGHLRKLDFLRGGKGAG